MAAEAALPCKLSAEIPIKGGAAHLFYEVFASKPHDLISASSGKFHSVEVHQGTPGTEGCIKIWNFTVDGQKHSAKTVIENLDMEKKTVTFKWLEGDYLKLYKHFSITIHVETKEAGDFVTWTTQYELLKPENPHPLSALSFQIELTKEIEGHVHQA